MALKYKIKSREEVAAELQPFYVGRDGAFYLDAEGATDKTKADEMRNHNIELRKQLEQLNARFDGIDPDEVRKLAAEKQRLEEERQLKAGELDKVVESRVKSLKADWDKQLSTVTAERDSLTSRLTAIQIDQGVITAATKRGLRPTAIPDITARARIVFKLVNGAPRAFEADGTTVRYGRDGVTPMTLEEWVDAQTSDAPHLFESNAGGGAASNPAGGGTGSNRSVENPFRKETWNLTEQMKLQKSDPALAARLKAAA
ncbi:MAG TPA: hypothetical protein PKA41_08380 [Verrucomicrobiota bacterium]|nr:hypothetical protein [Verrucomicrobiota bacterium]